MSATATLTFVGGTDAATSTHCLSTADAIDPTTHGSQEMADSSDLTFIYGGPTSSNREWAVGDFTDMPAALSIDSVTVVRRAARGMGSDPVEVQETRAVVRIGGTNYYSSAAAAPNPGPGDTSYTWTTNPATSAAWTAASVNAAQFGMEVYSDLAGTPPQFPVGIKITVTVVYTPVPPTVDVTRHVGSVSLWLKKRPEAFLQFDGNLDLLSLNLLDMADVEHTAGPHATDLGWEDEVWQRRPFAVHSMSIDLNMMTVTARLKDQRPIRCLLRDLAWSDKASGSLGDGIARFATPGATFSFTRASEHTFTNPVGESETVPVDTAAYGSGGLYMLSSSGGRAAPRYYVTNNSGKRTLNAAQGTFVCEVNLAAVSGAANQAVAYCYHDASNWWYLYWDGPNSRWVFEVRQAGSTYRATKSASPSSATWYQIGARWTGSNGELGASPYTLSVWVDRVKGTDVVAGGAMTEAASSNFDFGSKAAAGTEQLNGQIRKIHSFQEVMNDTEMARQI